VKADPLTTDLRWADLLTEAPPTSPVTIVLDPDDDYTTTRALLHQHAPADGTIVIHPTPATGGLHTLACDLLHALGKQPSARWETQRTLPELWAQVTAWIIGHQIDEIVLLRAHLQNRVRLARLTALAADTGATLTLVWHAHPPEDWTAVLPAATLAVLPTLDDRPAPQRWRPPDPEPDTQPLYCPAHTPGEPGHSLAAALTTPLPALPGAELATYRTRLRATLPADQFRHADALYTSGMDAACAYLTSHRDYDLRRLRTAQADRPIEDRYPHGWAALRSLRSFLLGLTSASPSASHTTTLLRGAQAGFLRHGLLLALPDDLGAHRGPGYFDAPLTPATADTIRTRVPHPARAAALALVLATGMHPSDLDHIGIDALAHDCSTRAMRDYLPDDGHDTVVHLPIPSYARDLFATARAYAHTHDSRARDRLLLGGFGTHDWLLYDTAKACDLPLERADRWWSIHYWHLNTTCTWIADPVHGNVHTDPGRQEGSHVPHP
jgi:hypothetical protein